MYLQLYIYKCTYNCISTNVPTITYLQMYLHIVYLHYVFNTLESVVLLHAYYRNK